jgi:F420H(2)-dependent quinone reductase
LAFRREHLAQPRESIFQAAADALTLELGDRPETLGEVRAEVRGNTRRYVARTLGAEEAKPIWPKLLAIWPAYESYQRKTTRVILIVELAPI